MHWNRTFKVGLNRPANWISKDNLATWICIVAISTGQLCKLLYRWWGGQIGVPCGTRLMLTILCSAREKFQDTQDDSLRPTRGSNGRSGRTQGTINERVPTGGPCIDRWTRATGRMRCPGKDPALIPAESYPKVINLFLTGALALECPMHEGNCHSWFRGTIERRVIKTR
jgi:hypothetical protein